MTRQEHPREDLLRDATALVRRGEFWFPGQTAPSVAGFRRDGSASFFFGSDLVVQFNATGEVRRGFDQGRLLKAEGGQLVALQRVRTERETQLQRQRLGSREAQEWLSQVDRLLAALGEALRCGTARCEGQQPPEGDLPRELATWLSLRGPLRIAGRPGIKE